MSDNKRGQGKAYVVNRETMLRMRESYAQGNSCVKVAKEFYVSQATVWRIINSNHPLISDLPVIARSRGRKKTKRSKV